MSFFTPKRPRPARIRRLFTGNTSTGSNSTSYNFASGFDFGPSYRKRDILVCVMHSVTTAGPSGVTVGGVAAALLVQSIGSASGNVSFWLALDVPSSGNVQIALSAETGRCGIAVYGVYNTKSGTAYDTAAYASPSNTEEVSVNLDVPANGLAAAGFYSGSTSGQIITWGGLNQDVQANVETSRTYSAASLETSSALPNHEIKTTGNMSMSHVLAAVSLA